MKRFTRFSLLLALSIVLNLVETSIPIFEGIVPGLRLGLANIIILFILYKYTFKDAVYISILRVILVGILRTGLFSINFMFSLSGALFSVIMMALVKQHTKLSIIGVSIVGSIFHSIGQILISIIIINTTSMVYYLPFLLLCSIPTGIFTGMITKDFIYNYDKVINVEGYY